MQSVWKFPIKWGDRWQEVEMPLDSRVLTAQNQDDTLVVWALVQTPPVDGRFIKREILTVYTGTVMPPGSWRYVATATRGALVYHVFDNSSVP